VPLADPVGDAEPLGDADSGGDTAEDDVGAGDACAGAWMFAGAAGGRSASNTFGSATTRAVIAVITATTRIGFDFNTLIAYATRRQTIAAITTAATRNPVTGTPQH
jgi:hypothetical protein